MNTGVQPNNTRLKDIIELFSLIGGGKVSKNSDSEIEIRIQEIKKMEKELGGTDRINNLLEDISNNGATIKKSPKIKSVERGINNQMVKNPKEITKNNKEISISLDDDEKQR